MSILKIPVFSQNTVIHKKAKKVVDIKNSEIQQLIFDMKETLKASQGLGLAAPQIGKSLRIFVIDKELCSDYLPRTEFAMPRTQLCCSTGVLVRGSDTFINPKIKRKSFTKSIEEEGCLSVPGIYKQINRSKGLVIEALDENGKKFQLKAAGLLARVIQHECDHLDGILITDR